jgi:hypothetical protein
MITGVAETVVVVAAAVVAFLILRPHVPIWAWFAMYVGAALYFFVHILTDGADAQRIGALAIFALAALHTWWRDLRGKNAEGPGPRTQQP